MAMPLNSCMAIPSSSYTQNHAFSIYRNSLSSISPASLCPQTGFFPRLQLTVLYDYPFGYSVSKGF